MVDTISVKHIDEHDIIENKEGLKGTVIHKFKNTNCFMVEYTNRIDKEYIFNIVKVFNGEGTLKIGYEK